jgi:hypothetical protein
MMTQRDIVTKVRVSPSKHAVGLHPACGIIVHEVRRVELRWHESVIGKPVDGLRNAPSLLIEMGEVKLKLDAAKAAHDPLGASQDVFLKTLRVDLAENVGVGPKINLKMIEREDIDFLGADDFGPTIKLDSVG